MRLPLALAAAVLVAAACSSPTSKCLSGCACQAQTDCPSGQSCVAGFCAVAQACTTDLDCSNPADVCVGGSCVSGTTDGGSSDGGRVDGGPPDAGPDAGLDAGPDGGSDAGPDAGRLDGGPDAGPPDAGPDAGPFDAGSPDAGCMQASDCAPLVCKGGSCQQCTANTDCVSPMICCLSGSCTPGTCIPAGCTSDIECNPPEEICVAGNCVAGCLLGSCDAGLRCDQIDTGRCQPASGNGNPGDPCQSFADCSATPSNSNSGDCLALRLADGGTQTFCSFACQGTTQCPPNEVCDLLGAAGQCVPEALLGGSYGSGATGASCTLGGATCDAIPACADYGSGGPVCSDTCLGPTSQVCPTVGWQCDDVVDFAGLVGAGTACTADSTCTGLSPDALCYTPARGGDGKCHLVYRQEDCFESPTGGGPTLTNGAACSSDSQCKFGFCNAGKCADPCCSSADCPSSFACTPVIAQQFSVVMACVPSASTGAIGAACDPTAASNSCRALQSSQTGGGGLCLPTNAYDSSSTSGYCSDYCCSDSECGAGFTCGLYEVGTDSKGRILYANACLEL